MSLLNLKTLFTENLHTIRNAAIILAAAVGLILLRLLFKKFNGVFNRDLYSNAESLYHRGRYAQALEKFRKIGHHGRIAACAVHLGDHGLAAQEYELDNDFYMAAKHHFHAGAHAKAATLYERVGRHVQAGEAYERSGELEKAAIAYRQGNALDHTERLYIKTKQFHLAAELFVEEYERERAHPPLSGDIHSKHEHEKRLQTWATKAAQAFEKEPDWKRAALMHEKAGDLNASASALVHAGELIEAAERYERAGNKKSAAETYAGANEYARAIAIYKELQDHSMVATLLETIGASEEAAQYLANIDLEQGQKLQAAQRLEQAGSYSSAAKTYQEIGEYEKAAALFAQADMSGEAADCFRQAGDLEKAAENYAKSHRYSSAAKCYLKLERTADYLNMLEQGKNYLEAGLYLSGKDNKQAIHYLQKITAESPDYRYASHLLGNLFMEDKLLTLAEEKFLIATKDLAVERNYLDFHYDLARLYMAQERHEESLAIIENILAIDYEYKDSRSIQKKLATELDRSSSGIRSSGGRTTNIANHSSDSEETRAPNNASAADTGDTKLINGRYEQQMELGRGGMGIVYRGFDRTLARPVALKFLPPALAKRREDIDKFLNEARSAARLNHTNIVTIYDIDFDEVSENYFMVLEYVDGANLSEIIGSCHNLPFGVIHLILSQVCEALQFAHEHRVLHRDIKSANILWTNEKVVKVTDFGLAKIIEESIATQTKVQGSPVYMSPEQVLGQQVDQRSDIYSLGITAYEMLTGEVPFAKGDIGYHHINTAPPSPALLRADTPGYLLQIVDRCLKKTPNERYANASALITDLQKHAGS